MPIEIYTGQPGNGKTALMMERLMDEAKQARRPLFVCGIKGLQPGLATPLKDARQWNAIKPGEVCTCDTFEAGEDDDDHRQVSTCTAHVIPAGSLIFVDEAWKWFGHLHDASRQATPPHVLKLAEHRHRGLDFVWTAQQPNQLYPFIRGLVGEHHHVVRRFGTKLIDVFSWGELSEDVKSVAKRENALRKTRTLPSQVFDSYKSAEVHTIKSRIPFKVLAIPGMVVISAVLAWLAYSMLKPDAFAERLTGKGPKSAQADSAPSVSADRQDKRGGRSYDNPTEYAKAHLPRFATMPWTAEVFDERSATADPQLYCMSSNPSETGEGGYTCTCLTEQGTRYEIAQGECRRVARHGMPYNPYRERRDQVMPSHGPEIQNMQPRRQGGAQTVVSDKGAVENRS